MRAELVVAHYMEDLDWLACVKERVPGIKVVVYDKGPVSDIGMLADLGIAVTRLQNVGREAHAYTTYVVDSYDALPDVVVFSQGDPRDHVDAHSVEEIADWVSMVARQATEHPSGLSQLGAVAHSVGGNSATADFRIFYKLVQYGDMNLGQWFESCTGRPYPASGALWYMGACFAATRAAVRSVPLDTWIRLRDSVAYAADPVTGHYAERSWYELMRPLICTGRMKRQATQIL